MLDVGELCYCKGIENKRTEDERNHRIQDGLDADKNDGEDSWVAQLCAQEEEMNARVRPKKLQNIHSIAVPRKSKKARILSGAAAAATRLAAVAARRVAARCRAVVGLPP